MEGLSASHARLFGAVGVCLAERALKRTNERTNNFTRNEQPGPSSQNSSQPPPQSLGRASRRPRSMMPLSLVIGLGPLGVVLRSTAVCRREVVLASLSFSCGVHAAHAEPPSAIIATGVVQLQNGATVIGAAEAALYVTVRPAEAGGGALQAGTKVVPLATARVAAPIAFPYKFQLTEADLTAEYKSIELSSIKSLDLLVSARFDGDGVAATRGPDDLVGRGLLRKAGSIEPLRWKPAVVELQGRGLTGRLLTGGK